MIIQYITNTFIVDTMTHQVTQDNNCTTKTRSNKKNKRPRSLLFRNVYSPYTQNEIKSISRVNFIITDEKCKSPLGKNVSYYVPVKDIKLVEDINFCSFLRKIDIIQ
jgi:hypothetical protein